jgi:hypothetical protein
MLLNDNVDFYGLFSVKAIDANGNVVDEYTEKNLIMDSARQNMAQLIGNVTTAGSAQGTPIDKFVIGTLGHVGTDILDYKKVGENGFDSSRTALFSEEDASARNYHLPFDVSGDINVTVASTGEMYEGSTLDYTDAADSSTVQRVVGGTYGRTVTYTITIPASCANSNDLAEPVIAYTEAALYAGEEIFSMKCFPARVKEDTVKFEISWSIIF